MARMFTALALGDLALAEPARWAGRARRALDAILADTERRVEEGGHGTFLLPYWHLGPTRGERRSLFVDGELLWMYAVRRLLGEEPTPLARGRALARTVERLLSAGPLLSAESYPNECWTFCNTVALAALRAWSGFEPRPSLAPAWVAQARRRLLGPHGALVSSFTWEGEVKEGPEGSSLWLSSHMLRLVDPAFAAEQYALARRLLGRSLGGLGWAREWPEGGGTATAHLTDVDSGPVIPWLEASPSSSGLALLAARSFGDDAFARALLASIEVGAFPARRGQTRRFLASNAIGDAVLLAGATAGPLWARLGAGGQT
jgi:hypothetical protein